MSARYEIRVRGRIAPAVAATFDGLTVELEPVETVIHGPLADPQALYAVIERLEALGIDLVEVRRLAGGAAGDQRGPMSR